MASAFLLACFVAGLACLAAAAFTLSTAAGFAVVGAELVAVAVGYSRGELR